MFFPSDRLDPLWLVYNPASLPVLPSTTKLTYLLLLAFSAHPVLQSSLLQRFLSYSPSIHVSCLSVCIWIFRQPFSYLFWGYWKPGQQSLWSTLNEAEGEIGKMARSRENVWCKIREIKPFVLTDIAANSNLAYCCQQIGVPPHLSRQAKGFSYLLP